MFSIKKGATLALVCTSLLSTRPVIADDSSGFSSLFNSFFGTESARSNSSNCKSVDSDSSMLGMVNGFFCHMEIDMGVVGATPTAGVTKSFTSSGGTMFVHAEVAGSFGGAAYSGYDYQGKVWICQKSASVACSSPSQFVRVVYITWSYKSDRSINKGVMWIDNSGFSGQTGSGMTVTYDVGNSTATKTVQSTLVEPSGSPAIYMTATATRNSAGQMSISLEQVQGTGGSASTYTFAAAVDPAKNIASASFATPISGTPPGTVATLSSQTCFTRSATATDWNYTATSSSTCSSMPTLAYPTTTPAALAATTAASLAPSTSTMGLNPNSI